MLNYTYVDNSNVFIEGQRVSAVKRKQARDINDAIDRGILDFDWNVDYGRLHEIVCGDRSEIGGARLWGSPPPGDSFWDMVKRKGWDVTVYDKSLSGKERKVDVAIAHRMTKDAYTVIVREAAELTLVAGDKDYVPVIEDLVKEGVQVSVAFWEHAARELKEAASSFFNLNPYVDIVGRSRQL